MISITAITVNMFIKATINTYYQLWSSQSLPSRSSWYFIGEPERLGCEWQHDHHHHHGPPGRHGWQHERLKQASSHPERILLRAVVRFPPDHCDEGDDADEDDCFTNTRKKRHFVLQWLWDWRSKRHLTEWNRWHSSNISFYKEYPVPAICHSLGPDKT